METRPPMKTEHSLNPSDWPVPRLIAETGSRLHFGLLSNQPQSGRLFGGVGAMIDSPRFVVAAQPAKTFQIDVTCENTTPEERDEIKRRVGRIASLQVADCMPAAFTGIHIEIRRCIRPHIGLGSGTQLALAVAKLLNLLAGEHADAVELATKVGRGARSALGIHGFERGGLMIDGGKSASDAVGALAARADLPSQWRFLLMTPADARGLSGDAERDAFAQLPPMDPAIPGRLANIAAHELKPAAEASDFDAFSNALYEFGRTVGEYFAPVQGGTFAHPDMRRLAATLREEQTRGVAQTSWGPTLVAVLKSAEDANELERRLAADPKWSGLSLHIAAPRNTGASVYREGEVEISGPAKW